MKKSLAHLPQYKRDELQRVKEIILDECPTVLMIILFGSQITCEQLEYLAARVKMLQDLTRKICAARIESYLST
jgi:hypothetical protein